MSLEIIFYLTAKVAIIVEKTDPMSHASGVLYLIPSLLFPDTASLLPGEVSAVIRETRHYFVENARSARRFLKALDRMLDINACEFSGIGKTQSPDLVRLRKWLEAGMRVGVISEAGYPCIADPGEALVREAHRIGATVIPLVGPNAMLMALAASGLNGEQFCFSGYLPIRSPERVKALKALEKRILQSGETQIFMETPYRNNQMLRDVLHHVQPSMLLCIATDITGPTQFIGTHEIRDWKQQVPDLNKRPSVFLLGRP